MSALVQAAPFTLIAAVIHKTRHKAQYVYPNNPYDMALTFCLERAYGFLHGLNHVAATTHVIVESRGKAEDNKLELSFLRTCAGNNYWNCALPFQVRFCSKLSNSTGMQLADLVARPIGAEVHRPGSQARIYPIIASKFRTSPSGKVSGWGLKVFP